MDPIKKHLRNPDPSVPMSPWRRSGPAMNVLGAPAGPVRWDGAMLASIVEHSQDAFVSLTPDGLMRSWNPGAERLFGYTVAEIVGKHVSLLVPPDRLREPEALFTPLFEGRCVPPFETIRRRRDGSLVDVELTLIPIVEEGRCIAIVTQVKDISVQKRAQEALRQSEARYDEVEKAAGEGVWDWNLVTHEGYASPRWKALLGFEEQDLPNNEDMFFPLVHPDDVARVREAIRLNLEEDQPYDQEFRMRCKDGSYRWFNSRGGSIRDESGRAIRMVGSITDISRRKETEERLRHQAMLLDQVSDAIVSTDLDFRITEWNKAAERTFGWTAEQVLGREADEVLGTEYLGTTKERAARNFLETGASSMEVVLRDQCRNTLTFQRDATPLKDDAGTVTGTALILRDLTERKQVERELIENAARLRAIFDQASAGIVQADLSGRILFANPRFCELLGWNPDELQRKNIRDITHPDDVARTLAQFKGAIEDGGCRGVEKRCLPKEGPAVWLTCSITPIMGASGKPKSVIVVSVDITLRKQAEEAARESEERFRRAFELGLVGMAITSPTKGWVEVNDMLCEILGYERRELLKLTWANLTHPDDLAADVVNFEKVMAGESEGYSMDKRFVRKDGRLIFATISARCLRRADGTVDYFVALVRDITARKLAEDALQLSEERFRLALLNQPLTVFSQDRDLRYTWVYNPHPEFRRENIVGKTDDELMPPEYAEPLLRFKRRVLETGRPARGEFRTPATGGDCWWDISLEPMRNAAGEITGVSGAAMIVTERKQLALALQESLDLLTKVSRQVPGVIYQFQLFPDGRSCFPYASDGIQEMYEVTPAQVREDASAVFAILHPEDYDGIVASIQESARTLKPWRYEYRVVLPRQGVRWRLGDSRPERLPDGSTLWHGFITDITERKRVQEALTASERQLSAIYANVSGVIFCIDVLPGGKFRFAMINQEFTRVTGLSEEEVIGRMAEDVIAPESVAFVLQKYEEAVRTGAVVRWEEVSVYPAGEKHGEVIVTPVAGDRGDVTHLIGIVHDITARKLAAAELARANSELEFRVAARTADLSLANASLVKAIAERRRLENEILEINESERGRIGRDLHDDLGQQLAGIGWLAAALQKQIPADAPEWKASATRIAELANNALAFAKSLARGLHPVPSERGGLMAALHELAAHSSGLFHVDCQFTCPRPVTLGDPNAATHLYRIAQEAVTNAVRHGKAGNIQISLASTGGKITLTITDDGHAAKEQKQKREGLGMRIMNYRAETLGGVLKFTQKPGAGARITCQIPILADAARKPRKAVPSKPRKRKA